VSRRRKDGSPSILPETVRVETRGRRATKKKRVSKLIDDPIALTSGGAVIINITHLEDTTDVAAVIARLIGEGHRLFIGIAVPGALRRELRKGIDDAGADIVGRLGGRLRRAKRR
jgi:hypothetical protein